MTSVWGDQSQVSFTPSLRSRRLISMQHLTGEVQVWSNVRHSSWSMTRADKELSPVVCKCLKHIWTCVENLLNWLSQLTHWVLAWWRSEQEQCGFNQRVILATVFPLVPHLPPIWLPLISEMYLSCPFCIRQHAHPAKSKLSKHVCRALPLLETVYCLFPIYENRQPPLSKYVSQRRGDSHSTQQCKGQVWKPVANRFFALQSEHKAIAPLYITLVLLYLTATTERRYHNTAVFILSAGMCRRVAQ